MSNEFHHVSVLLEECIEGLNIKSDGIYVDGTLGGAGHSSRIAAELTTGRHIGIDRDPIALKAAGERLKPYGDRVTLVHSNFCEIKSVLDNLDIEGVDGILLDLGVSSPQLDDGERGFSYMHDGPLDMRMNKDAKLDAEYIVNNYKEDELAELIYKYGEERWSKRIAQFIVNERKNAPITTTYQLVDIIKKAIPKGARIDGPHPAKRTFQAIRIEVNNELGILENTMITAVERLKSGGRIGVITFHSLEDRIIKQTFAKLAKGCTCPPQLPVCVCGKKPLLKKVGNITPSKEEVEENPRSRSARLRYAIKI